MEYTNGKTANYRFGLVLICLLLTGCLEARPTGNPEGFEETQEIMDAEVDEFEINEEGEFEYVDTTPEPVEEPGKVKKFFQEWRNKPVLKQILDLADLIAKKLFGDQAWIMIGAALVILALIKWFATVGYIVLFLIVMFLLLHFAAA